MPPHPPDVVDAELLVLRRPDAGDAERMAESVAANLDHLSPWMPWATPEAGMLAMQRERLAAVDADWDAGREYNYLALTTDEQVVLGRFGLHRRIGPGALELGYWLTADASGRGYATAAARALTAAALAVPGVARVEIRCDEANVRSRRVPERLGYRLDRIEEDGIEAPAEVGRGMVWVFPPDAPISRFVRGTRA